MRSLALSICLAFLVSGCATPTELQLQQAEQSHKQAQALLDAFAQAVRQKNVDLAMGCLSENTPLDRRLRMRQAVEGAVWLESYAGYTLETERALAAVDWRRWSEGRAAMRIPAVNKQGQRFKDSFVIRKQDDRWLLEEFRLREPVSGDALDPPEEDAQEIRARLQWFINCLKNKKAGDIYYRLPEPDECRFRPLKRGLFSRLLGRPHRYRNVFQDLQDVLALDVRAWPDFEGYLPLSYVARGEVLAVFELPHSGLADTEELLALRVELRLRERDGQWSLHRIRFY